MTGRFVKVRWRTAESQPLAVFTPLHPCALAGLSQEWNLRALAPRFLRGAQQTQAQAQLASPL